MIQWIKQSIKYLKLTFTKICIRKKVIKNQHALTNWIVEKMNYF